MLLSIYIYIYIGFVKSSLDLHSLNDGQITVLLKSFSLKLIIRVKWFHQLAKM